MNSLRSSIRFTSELESEDCLPFLDIHIKKSQQGLTFSVFRKPTDTGAYLNRNSCHPRSVFRGLISCLKKRTLEVCSPLEVNAELKRLKRLLRLNGFHDRELRCLDSIHFSKRSGSKLAPAGVIPYVPDLSDKVAKIFKKTGKSLFMKPGRSLAASLVRKKPERGKDPRGMVYMIPCKDCPWRYVGETGRTLTDRLSEHKRAVRTFRSNSEVSCHVHDESHTMAWDAVEVLCREENHFKRIFKEAWHTRSHGGGNRVFTQVNAEWDVLF